MSKNSHSKRRDFPRMALPADVVRDGWIWMSTPSLETLRRRYRQITAAIDAELRRRAKAAADQIAAESGNTLQRRG